MVWSGRHFTPLGGRTGHDGPDRRGLHVQQVVQHERLAARLRGDESGGAWADVIGKMINTSLSCVPPISQWAGQAALEHDSAERDEVDVTFSTQGGAAGRSTAESAGGTGSRCSMPRAETLRVPRRLRDLQEVGNHVTRPGNVPAGSGGRQTRGRVSGRRVFRSRRARASSASVVPNRTTACSKRSTSFRRRSHAPTVSRRGSTRTRNTGSRSRTRIRIRTSNTAHARLCPPCDAFHRSSRIWGGYCQASFGHSCS